MGWISCENTPTRKKEIAVKTDSLLTEVKQTSKKEITSKTLERVQLQKALDEADVKGVDERKVAQKKIEENEKDISELKEDNEKIEKKTGMSADTGQSDQGFGKFQELKEAFMVMTTLLPKTSRLPLPSWVNEKSNP